MTNRNGIGIEINPKYEKELREYSYADIPTLDYWCGTECEAPKPLS